MLLLDLENIRSFSQAKRIAILWVLGCFIISARNSLFFHFVMHCGLETTSMQKRLEVLSSGHYVAFCLLHLLDDTMLKAAPVLCSFFNKRTHPANVLHLTWSLYSCAARCILLRVFYVSILTDQTTGLIVAQNFVIVRKIFKRNPCETTKYRASSCPHMFCGARIVINCEQSLCANSYYCDF